MFDQTVIEETVAAEEPRFDEIETIVLEKLDEISGIFKKVSAVRESHQAVQDLLVYAGHSSWESFVEEFKEQIDEYFFDEEADQPKPEKNSIEDRRIRVAQALYDNAVKATTTLAETIKAMETQIAKMAKAKQAAELVILEHQFNNWDSETTKKTAEAQRTVSIINSQLPALDAKLKAEKSKQSRLNQEARYAEARKKAASRDGMLMINTGDIINDAEIFAKIAGNCHYKIASLFTAIAKLRKNLDATGERYQAIESVSEHIYDSELDRLTRLETACDLQFEIIANAEWGYESCINARALDSTGYFPEFPALWKGIREAQSRLATSAVKRAQDQANTLMEMQKSGLL